MIFLVYYLNDLWSYNLNSNEWTWIGGSSSAIGSPIQGTLLTENQSNTPGGRQLAAISATQDSLYIMGGFGMGSDGLSGKPFILL